MYTFILFHVMLRSVQTGATEAGNYSFVPFEITQAGKLVPNNLLNCNSHNPLPPHVMPTVIGILKSGAPQII